MYNLSIIIPLYNEEKRLPKSLKILEKFCQKKLRKDIEIIFVSDGSSDRTNKIINLFINKNKRIFNSFLIKYSKNVGKGYAVKKGILNSKKDWILICDADMSVDPEQFNLWFKNKKIVDKNKAYFGSRRLRNSNVETSLVRKTLGLIFIIFIKFLLNINLKDSQCGFKVFHRNYALRVFKKVSSFRFAFDVELIIILDKFKIKIIELPLKWTHQSGSKLSIASDIPIMIFDLIMIKFNNQK